MFKDEYEDQKLALENKLIICKIVVCICTSILMLVYSTYLICDIVITNNTLNEITDFSSITNFLK